MAPHRNAADKGSQSVLHPLRRAPQLSSSLFVSACEPFKTVVGTTPHPLLTPLQSGADPEDYSSSSSSTLGWKVTPCGEALLQSTGLWLKVMVRAPAAAHTCTMVRRSEASYLCGKWVHWAETCARWWGDVFSLSNHSGKSAFTGWACWTVQLPLCPAVPGCFLWCSWTLFSCMEEILWN